MSVIVYSSEGQQPTDPRLPVHMVNKQGDKCRRLETHEDEEYGIWQGRRKIIRFFFFRYFCIIMGFRDRTVDKESACDAGDKEMWV